MIRIPTHRKPTHPGEMLLEEFLIPMGLTQRELADKINLSYKKINLIVKCKSSINPSIALRLAKFFGVSPDFWMNLQLRWDIYHAEKAEAASLKMIQPFQLQQEAAQTF